MQNCSLVSLLFYSFSSAGGEQSACYMHDHSQNEWTLFGNLNTARNGLASALLDGDLWMTGGHNRDDKLKLPRFLFKTINL